MSELTICTAMNFLKELLADEIQQERAHLKEIQRAKERVAFLEHSLRDAREKLGKLNHTYESPKDNPFSTVLNTLRRDILRE